jgi:nicotinamidase-related amidase
MAVDLRKLLDPAHTAIVTQECQGAVIGADPALPQLAEIAQRVAVPNIARLVRGARAADVPVVHCLAMRRADGRGSNHNARLFLGMLKNGVPLLPGTDAVEVIPEIGVEPSDVVLSRLHGLGPMGGTDLDPVLRNLGVTTIVGVGVSVNVAMLNFAMDAVNAGYQFVLPRDAVAGIPEEYAEAVIDNTLSLLTTVTTTDEVLEVWSGP